MNITPNFQTLKLPAVVQQRQNNQRVFLANNNQDTFTHSAPSFKCQSTIEKMAFEALKDPKIILPILGALFALNPGAAKTFQDLINKLTEEGKNTVPNSIPNYVYTSTTTEQSQDTYSYYTDDSSISDISEDNSFAEKDNKSVKQSTEKTKNANLIQFKYRRTKRPTINETALAGFVNQLLLSKDYIEKLNDICLKLQNVHDSYKINDKTLSTKEITPIFYSELVKTQNEDYSINYDAVKNIINKYSSYMEKSVPAEVVNIKNNGFVNPTKAKPGDKIPLTPNDANRLKNIEQKGQGAKEECITRNQRGEITSIEFDKENSDYVYTHEQLDAMFQQFAITIYNDYKDKSKYNPRLKKPQWMYNCGLKKQVTADDIRKEIESTDTANRLINKPTNCFQHIVNENYEELADVINNNPIYRQLFTIHSALRFMDRFIIFKDGYPSIEEQSNSLLKKLTEMIDDAYNNGATILVNNKRDKHNFKKGANIILRPKADDNEAIRMFGDKGIIIGIIERQDELTNDGKVKYNPVGDNEKRAIIATTLYPKR